MILFILPVRNESKTVKKTAETLWSYLLINNINSKIIFIDDGSSDKTAYEIESIQNKNIQIIRNKFDNGKGSALKTGFILSNLMFKMKDNDLIFFMDGDGQINPSEITTFLNLMNLYTADAVIGNKRHSYSYTHYGLIRNIISSTYNFIIRFLFGFNFRDTQCGIKVFRKNVLDRVIELINVKSYAFDLELIVALRSLRYRIIDAPVNINRQINSGSVSLITIINTFIDTLKIWFKMRKGYYV